MSRPKPIDPPVLISLPLPASLLQRVRHFSTVMDVPLTQVVRHALRNHLAAHPLPAAALEEDI